MTKINYSGILSINFVSKIAFHIQPE